MHITLLDERASKAPLNLDVLSGLTGLNLEVEGEYGSKTVTKLGVSLKPFASKAVPLQVVSMHPRYVILNESDEIITVRQCFVEVSLCFSFLILAFTCCVKLIELRTKFIFVLGGWH